MLGSIQVAVPKHLGDAVLALPALRMLAAVPSSSLRLVCPAESVLDLLADQGCWQRGSSQFLTIHGSLAVLLAPSLRVALQARRAKVETCIGLASDSRGILLTHVVPGPVRPLPQRGLPKLLVAEHQGRSYRRIARFVLDHLGCKALGEIESAARYRASDDARAEADMLWHQVGQPSVLLHPFARGLASKRWPHARWVSLGRELQAKGHKILVSGGPHPEDAQCAAALAGALVVPVSAGNSSLSPAAWVALAALCEVVVLCDTGLSHLCAAAGQDPVVLFGSTDPDRHAPIRGQVLWHGDELDCAPCYRDQCRHPKGQICMAQDVGSVARVVLRQAQSRSSERGEGAPCALR